MQNRNYQKELEQIIEKAQAAGIRPRLFLHSCCAPCSSYVMEYLSRYFDITLFFYNPNIDTEEEYKHRIAELERLIGEMPLSSPVCLIAGAYEPGRFYEIAKGHEKDPERGERCLRCYRLRLRETAEWLKRNADGAFDYFATTLSISPMKDAKALNAIGEEIAAEYGFSWLPSDFKKKDGYKRSIALSHEYGLYRQDYCGCVFSKRAALERERQTVLDSQM